MGEKLLKTNSTTWLIDALKILIMWLAWVWKFQNSFKSWLSAKKHFLNQGNQCRKRPIYDQTRLLIYLGLWKINMVDFVVIEELLLTKRALLTRNCWQNKKKLFWRIKQIGFVEMIRNKYRFLIRLVLTRILVQTYFTNEMFNFSFEISIRNFEIFALFFKNRKSPAPDKWFLSDWEVI